MPSLVRLDNSFLDIIPKAQMRKAKLDKWDSIQPEASAQQKKLPAEWTGSLQNRRKSLQPYM
jgi:hypothetical protein